MYETYLIEKMDKETPPGSGWSFFTDVTNASISNVDIDFIAHMLKIIISYYPRGTKSIYIYNLPKQLEEAVPLVFDAMKELRSTAKFLNATNLRDALDESNYPDYFKALTAPAINA